MAGFAQPERAGSAEVEAVVATVDLKSGSEAPGAAGEIEEPGGLAMALHELDAFERFEGTDEDCGGDSGRLAGRIGLRFHNAAAEAARGEIVDDNSSDEEASEIDGVRWKLSAAEAADGEFRW